jgi:catechol 2,3-dioxygenase-like lactoylglutathione lyase family enzyme
MARAEVGHASHATLSAMSHSDTAIASSDVQRTDFVSIPVRDIDRAKAFYRDTLGMHSSDWEAAWPEIETGNVSIYLVDPTAMTERSAGGHLHLGDAGARRCRGSRRPGHARAHHREQPEAIDPIA